MAAFQITERPKEGPVPNITVDRRLFLTADKDRLVDPDDPAAAFLWANTGDEVTAEEAKRVGYTGGKVTKADDETPDAEPAPDEAEDGDKKAADAPEDKAEPAPAEDKAATAKRGRK